MFNLINLFTDLRGKSFQKSFVFYARYVDYDTLVLIIPKDIQPILDSFNSYICHVPILMFWQSFTLYWQDGQMHVSNTRPSEGTQ